MNKHQYTPINNEKLYKASPVMVTYTCERCNNGEMILDQHTMPRQIGNTALMFRHQCDNPECGYFMELPKQYPYIEWIRKEKYETT